MAGKSKNKNIFEQTNNIKSYVLGFLWADGHLLESGVSTELSEKDFENLNNIIPKTGGKWKIRHRERFLKKTGKYYKQCSFTYHSKLTSEFLKSMDYDIKSNTQPIKILEYIPMEYHRDFFRGYIDGDS